MACLADGQPPDLTRALDAAPAARTTWDDFPPSARKQMLWWILSAEREETRAPVATVVAEAREGRRAKGWTLTALGLPFG